MHRGIRPPAGASEIHRRTRVAAEIMTSGKRKGKARVRCAICHNYWTWGAPAFDGRYCSAKCAGLSDQDVELLHRYRLFINSRCTCYTRRGTHKVIYADWESAELDRADLESQDSDSCFRVYACERGFIHVGTLKPEPV